MDNELGALKAIRAAGRLTRQDIADQLGISLSLATKLVADLIGRGLIARTGKVDAGSGGRPANWLTLMPAAAYAIGMDIGDQQQVAVVIDLAGDVLVEATEPALVTDNREVIVANLKALVERVVAASGLDHRQIAGVGIGLSDMVDPMTRVSYGWPDTPGWSAAWTDFAVGAALDAVLGVPHVLVDDIVRTLGLAETRYGQHGSDRDFAYVLADTGVGLAIMLRGMPYIGHSHIAGEIAHLQVDPQGQVCSCGNRGCLQTVTGIPAVLSFVTEHLAASPIRSVLRQSDRPVDLAMVLAAAEAGDKLARNALSDAGENLGRALAMVVNLLGPAAFVLGGALSRSPDFADAAHRAMIEGSLSVASRGVTFETSQMDRLAGARGAATQVLDALFSDCRPNLLDLTSKARP